MGRAFGTELARRAVAAVILLTPVTFAGCDDGGVDPQFDGIRIGEITYRVKDLVVAESFPVQIGVTVEIGNGSSSPQSVIFADGCVVLLRAYDDRSEPAWDMRGAVACTQALVQVDLPPGGTREFQTGLVSAATILGDSLPNGAYRITAYLRPSQTQLIELEAGVVDLGVL